MTLMAPKRCSNCWSRAIVNVISSTCASAAMKERCEFHLERRAKQKDSAAGKTNKIQAGVFWTNGTVEKDVQLLNLCLSFRYTLDMEIQTVIQKLQIHKEHNYIVYCIAESFLCIQTMGTASSTYTYITKHGYTVLDVTESSGIFPLSNNCCDEILEAELARLYRQTLVCRASFTLYEYVIFLKHSQAACQTNNSLGQK